MNDVPSKFSVDEAMAGFSQLANSLPRLPDAEPAHGRRPPTFAEAEAQLFSFAEGLLTATCPAPARCSDHRCRRNRLCRHFEKLRTIQHPPLPQPPSRRSPGAQAVRYAIWVYMNANFA
jgi:hypothetical protein